MATRDPNFAHPDELLSQMLRWALNGANYYPGGSVGEALARDFLLLHEQLSSGGRLPTAWSNAVSHMPAPVPPPPPSGKTL